MYEDIWRRFFLILHKVYKQPHQYLIWGDIRWHPRQSTGLIILKDTMSMLSLLRVIEAFNVHVFLNTFSNPFYTWSNFLITSRQFFFVCWDFSILFEHERETNYCPLILMSLFWALSPFHSTKKKEFVFLPGMQILNCLYRFFYTMVTLGLKLMTSHYYSNLSALTQF